MGLALMDADDYKQQLLDHLPRGKAWTRKASSVLAKLFDGIAPEFARVDARAQKLLAEMNPATADEMLPEWENAHGLPDPCGTPPITLSARQAALLGKLRSQAGHNPADYVAIADAMGHAGTQVFRRPCEPFRCGVGRCGDHIYSEEWVHVFIVAYMANLIDEEDRNDFSAWATSTTVTPDNGFAPDETLTASRIEMLTASAHLSYFFLTPYPTTAQLDVWLRADSGTTQVYLRLIEPGGGTVVEQELITIGEQWKRYSLRASHANGIWLCRIVAPGTVPGIFFAWGAGFGEVDEAFECRLDHAAQGHSLPIYTVQGDLQG